MWVIEGFELRNVDLDFTSSCQGFLRDRALYFDGTCVINALGIAVFDRDPVQLIICEHCGIIGCASGGWLAFRRAGDMVILSPAFLEMLEEPSEAMYCAPPGYVGARGVPVIPFELYSRIRELTLKFPDIGSIVALNSEEALRIAQYEAPGSILGRLPNPVRLSRDSVVAVSSGEVDEQCDRLESLLHELEGDQGLPMSAQIDQSVEPVEFYLDLPEFPVWRPFASGRNGLRLFMEPGICFCAA